MSCKIDFSSLSVTVMGLGLNGGGLESARFLAQHGAQVCVTDLRDETILQPSIEKLSGLPIRYVLGRHEEADFRQADFVVKNPAVRPDSPWLAMARRVETDISLFLTYCPARVLAVTGSKGKSSTSSALHWALAECGRRAYLGGNITVSPLSFLEDLLPEDEVVLELSSWQLGDLKGRLRPDGAPLCKPRCAIITSILPDHLDRYGTMDVYVADKRLIYAGQNTEDCTIVRDDEWGRSFAAETRGRPIVFSERVLPVGQDGAFLSGDGRGWLRRDSEELCILPQQIAAPGAHQRMNLLAVAAALVDLGLDAEHVGSALARWPGIEHRLEAFHQGRGIQWYNDTAATIPEAAAAAITSFTAPLLLLCGGTDKELDFSPLADAAPQAKAIALLAGTGTDKLLPLLKARGVDYLGPFDTLDAAILALLELGAAGDVAVLSPGCASFGMFLNEFDRGRKWKDAVRRLASD